MPDQYPTAVRLVLLLLVPLVSIGSRAATMDDYLTCGLVYGALFEASRRAQHDGMIQYTKPRLQAVQPYLEAHKDDPAAKRRLKELATQLETEIKDQFVTEAFQAIVERDVERLRQSMPRVFECDRAFHLATLPLPIARPVAGDHVSVVACQATASSGLNWKTGRWRPATYAAAEEFELSLVNRMITPESAAAALGSSTATCTSTIGGADVVCIDSYGSTLLFGPSSLHGAISHLFGGSSANPNRRDSVAVVTFECRRQQ